MAAFKLDVPLEAVDRYQAAASRLRPGDPFRLHQLPDGTVQCRTLAPPAAASAAAAAGAPRALAGAEAGVGGSDAADGSRPVSDSAVDMAVDSAAEAGAGREPSSSAGGTQPGSPEGSGDGGGGSEPFGHVPAAVCWRLPDAAEGGSVRSVRRGAGGEVAGVLVRVTLEPPRARPGSRAPATDEENEEESVNRLRQPQLEQLAAAEDVRAVLRDARLQEVIRQVDSADNREQALEEALQNPNFKEFTDRVLEIVGAAS